MDLVGQILAASPLSVALLLACGLGYLLLQQRRGRHGRMPTSDPLALAAAVDPSWVGRMNEHAARSHQHASLLTAHEMRLDQQTLRSAALEADLRAHKAEDSLAHERVARLEAHVDGLRDGQEQVRDAVARLDGKVDLVLLRLPRS